MKRVSSVVLALVLSCAWVLSQGVLHAQGIAGTWQGALQAGGRELRIVIKISTADAGLQGVMYSIDQGGQPIPVNPLTVQGSTVKFSVPAIGATYDGRLSADGASIAGTFTQGGAITLNLTRATDATAWAIPERAAPPKPMAANADPAFDVTSIKPSNPDTPGRAILIRGRQFSTLNTSLSYLITFAYGVQARQITGGPDWLESSKFDLIARPEGEGQPNDAQWKTMVQKMLADRFKLAFHRDRKELPVYAIVVGKTGPRLTQSGGNPNGLPSLFFRGPGVLPARNASMADLAGVMQSSVLDRPVVDQTGLAGRFDFTLTWTPDETQFGGLRIPPPADPATAPPNLFTAIEEQLGLRLESTRAPAEVLVLDRVEKPSPD